MTKGLAVVALAMSVAVVSARPAPRQTHSARDRASIWLKAVKEHRPGELDEAARAVEQWPEADLIDAATLERKGWGNDFPEANRLLSRAALLHVDIAILHRSLTGYDLPSGGPQSVEVHDGEQIGSRTGIVHWNVGRWLLNQVRPKPAADERVRIWYRATSAFLQAWNEYNELEPNLKRGLELFPDDAILLLYAGTMHESYAEPRLQNASVGPVLKPGRAATFGSPANELEHAERAFRDALAVDPNLAEARIRLGHVLGLRGRHAEAVEALRQALKQPLRRLLEYYALILVGREQVILGDTVPAVSAFRRAADLYAGAQSPHLGLSQIARDAGDESAALIELALLDQPPGRVDREDPFWRFNSSHDPGLKEMIADLRQQLAR